MKLKENESQNRWNPLTRKWVVIAPERGLRPGSYLQNEPVAGKEKGPDCPFCAGNEDMTPPAILTRADKKSKDRWSVRVVPNKYPILKVENTLKRTGHGLYDVTSGVGAHEVVIETDSCQTQLAEMIPADIARVFEAYRSRIHDLRRDIRLRYFTIFKNHGKVAGATLAHSHSQIVGLPERPDDVNTMLSSAREHYQKKERCIFCDILEAELSEQSRVIYEDHNFVAFVPYASALPFEVTIMPVTHSHDFAAAGDSLLLNLATVFKDVMFKLNRALGNPAYNFMIHTAPPAIESPAHPDYWSSIEHDFHWHMRIVPRITNLAGFELSTGMTINPVDPERAAEFLRSVHKHA